MRRRRWICGWEGYVRTYSSHPTDADLSIVNTGHRFMRIKDPGPGHPGAPGAPGLVLVSWDKTEVETDG